MTQADLFSPESSPTPDCSLAGQQSGGFSKRSLEAFHSIKESAETVRNSVEKVIRNRGRVGAIADELVEWWGCTHNHVAPRITELVAQGRIFRNGQKRKTRSGRNADVFVTPEAI